MQGCLAAILPALVRFISEIFSAYSLSLGPSFEMDFDFVWARVRAGASLEPARVLGSI